MTGQVGTFGYAAYVDGPADHRHETYGLYNCPTSQKPLKFYCLQLTSNEFRTCYSHGRFRVAQQECSLSYKH